MSRPLIQLHFDPTEPVGVDPAEVPTPSDAAADPAPAAAVTPAPDTSWAPSRDEWEQTQQFLQAAQPFLQNLAWEREQAARQASAPASPTLPEWDPFDEDVVQAHFEHRVSQAIEQALGPYQGLLGHVAQETSQREAERALEGLSTDIGTFDRDAALLIAAPMIDAGQMPDRALRAAAQYMHELEGRIRSDERERYQRELEGLRNAGPSSTGAAPGVTATEFDKVPTGPRRYHEAIERALARRQGGFPVG